MWNKRRSLLLSKVCVLLFMALLLAMLVAAPWLAGWLTSNSSNTSEAQMPLFLITMYTGGVAAAGLLFYLYRFLHNLGKSLVFTAQNVSFLRRASWCAFGGALICLASGFYYILWWVIALAAATLGLLMRVVKNLVAEAIALKEENDYTI